MATTFDVEHKQTSTYSSYIRYEQVHAQTAHVQDMDTETLLKKTLSLLLVCSLLVSETCTQERKETSHPAVRVLHLCLHLLYLKCPLENCAIKSL